MEVKMDNNTLEVLASVIREQEGWDLNELICDLLGETGMMKSEVGKEFTVNADECSIVWGDIEDGEDLCNASDLINDYTRRLLKGVCNVIESFKNQECYLHRD